MSPGNFKLQNTYVLHMTVENILCKILVHVFTHISFPFPWVEPNISSSKTGEISFGYRDRLVQHCAFVLNTFICSMIARPIQECPCASMQDKVQSDNHIPDKAHPATKKREERKGDHFFFMWGEVVGQGMCFGLS